MLVQITDSCPECQANQFDIQALTFNKVGAFLTLDSVLGDIVCIGNFPNLWYDCVHCCAAGSNVEWEDRHSIQTRGVRASVPDGCVCGQ